MKNLFASRTFASRSFWPALFRGIFSNERVGVGGEVLETLEFSDRLCEGMEFSGTLAEELTFSDYLEEQLTVSGTLVEALTFSGRIARIVQ